MRALTSETVSSPEGDKVSSSLLQTWEFVRELSSDMQLKLGH